MHGKPGQFSRYEAKVKLSILLMLLILVISNFAASFLFKRTQELFYDYQSDNQRMIGQLCQSALLNASSISETLYSINRIYGDDEGITVDVIKRTDYESASSSYSHYSKSRIMDAFNNIETYEYHPASETQIQYLPLKLDQKGEVESVLVIRDSIKWFGFLSKASKWDNIFRLAGIIAVIIFSALIIRMITKPYSNIRSLAASTLDHQVVNEDDPNYAERAFDEVVNELKRKETKLREIELNDAKKSLGLTGNFDYVFGGISSGIIIIDKEGSVVRFNAPASNILEIDIGEAFGKSYEVAFGKYNEIRDLVIDALGLSKIYSRVEFKVPFMGGRNKIVGATSSLIKNEDGETMGMAIMLLDLTRIKRIESEESYREKMAALGEMSAGMAHEIRNSAAAIAGFGKLLMKFAANEKKVQELSEDILKESSELEILMRKFLTFARPIEINREAVDISVLIAECVNSLGTLEGGIRIKIQVMPGLPHILADFQLLKQCFCNIIRNALEALDQRGNIIIKATPFQFRLGGSNETSFLEYLKITVADDGKGIAPEMREKLFDPFITDKDRGSGLGLAIVRKIIALHNGLIRVHTRVGKGTIFSILLLVGMQGRIHSDKEHPCSIISLPH